MNQHHAWKFLSAPIISIAFLLSGSTMVSAQEGFSILLQLTNYMMDYSAMMKLNKEYNCEMISCSRWDNRAAYIKDMPKWGGMSARQQRAAVRFVMRNNGRVFFNVDGMDAKRALNAPRVRGNWRQGHGNITNFELRQILRNRAWYKHVTFVDSWGNALKPGEIEQRLGPLLERYRAARRFFVEGDISATSVRPAVSQRCCALGWVRNSAVNMGRMFIPPDLQTIKAVLWDNPAARGLRLIAMGTASRFATKSLAVLRASARGGVALGRSAGRLGLISGRVLAQTSYTAARAAFNLSRILRFGRFVVGGPARVILSEFILHRMDRQNRALGSFAAANKLDGMPDEELYALFRDKLLQKDRVRGLEDFY